MGLAIDTERQKLYYAGRQNLLNSAETGTDGKVGELSTDGTGHRVLISDMKSMPWAVVLDSDNR